MTNMATFGLTKLAPYWPLCYLSPFYAFYGYLMILMDSCSSSISSWHLSHFTTQPQRGIYPNILFLTWRSNLFAQQKSLQPRKFKSYKSSWQRPAHTIQIPKDKSMPADFFHELLLADMQSRVLEPHENCISWCLGRVLEWNAAQPSMENWRLSVLLPQTRGHKRSYSSCIVSRKRWKLWWVMSYQVGIAGIACNFCWILLVSFSYVFSSLFWLALWQIVWIA